MCTTTFLGAGLNLLNVLRRQIPIDQKVVERATTFNVALYASNTRRLRFAFVLLTRPQPTTKHNMIDNNTTSQL